MAAAPTSLPILTAEDRAEIRANERRIAEAERNRKAAEYSQRRTIGFAANFGGGINDSYFAHGIEKARTYKKKIPQWVYNDAFIQKLLLQAFPKCRTDQRDSPYSQRNRAGLWATIINLHYRNGYTASQIADELGSTTLKVKGVMRSIRRGANGLRADSKKPRTNNRGENLKAGPQHPRSKKLRR